MLYIDNQAFIIFNLVLNKTHFFMKQLITLIALCLMTTGMLSAQAFIVNSPAEIAGGYDFAAAADFGATLDMVWTADAVFVNDGTANPTQGCEAAINAAELEGKIALIDRGSCEFGLKCLNAENAGAIAAVVINNSPGNGVIEMGAGQVGGMVTIPSVMIPFEVGQLIRNALITGAVNISLGDLVPPPPPANDLVLFNRNVLVPQLGIVPADQVRAEGDFVFTPGLRVENRGTNDAPNLEIDVVINHLPFEGSPAEVYSESFSSDEALLVGDTTDIIVFPDFDPFSTGAGIYEYTYSVESDSTDNADFNNTTTGSFTLIDQNLYSKARWDPIEQAPRVIATTTIAGGGAVEFLNPLQINYSDNANLKIDSIWVEVRLAPTLADVPIEAYVYAWDDADDNSILSEGELSIAGLAFFTFPSDFDMDGTLLKLPVLDLLTFEETGVPITEDGQKFVVGVRYNAGTETVSFGFDSSTDYFLREIYLNEQDSSLTDLDYGMILQTTFDEDGLPTFPLSLFENRLTSSTGVLLSQIVSNTEEEIAGLNKFELEVFPNPTSSQLNITLDFSEQAEYVEYILVNSMGQVVERQRTTDTFLEQRESFDVSQLPAGEYHVVILTDFGMRTSSFAVSR
jgi:hypothetical protein